MEVVVTTGAMRRAKLQSKCHHQQTITHMYACVKQLAEWSGGENGVSSSHHFYSEGSHSPTIFPKT